MSTLRDPCDRLYLRVVQRAANLRWRGYGKEADVISRKANACYEQKDVRGLRRALRTVRRLLKRRPTKEVTDETER